MSSTLLNTIRLQGIPTGGIVQRSYGDEVLDSTYMEVNDPLCIFKEFLITKGAFPYVDEDSLDTRSSYRRSLYIAWVDCIHQFRCILVARVNRIRKVRERYKMEGQSIYQNYIISRSRN